MHNALLFLFSSSQIYCTGKKEDEMAGEREREMWRMRQEEEESRKTRSTGETGWQLSVRVKDLQVCVCVSVHADETK